MSSEAEVKELADLRQWIEDRIRSMEEELEFLKKLMVIVDKQLSEKSFVKAAAVPAGMPAPQPPLEPQKQIERRQLKRQRDGYLLGEAEISDDQLRINIATDVVLRSSTKPFRNYFVNKILGGMRADDEKQVEQGKLDKDKVLQFDIEEEGGRIRSITVRGFRDKARLNEIISTAVWTFTKMLEQQA
ncbi:MAG: hypothetical protein QXX17_01435 [Conexivisphaerales archaeon]